MNRFLRLLAVVSALVSLISTPRAQTVSGGSMPLPENYFPALKTLIDGAVKQSPRMISRNTEDAIAEGNRIIARAGQLPSVGGSFAYYPWDRQDRAGLTETVNVKKMAYSASLTQPLFHWGALRNTTRIGELQQKITQGQTAEAYRLLVNEIRAQYLQLILKKAGLTRVRYNQKIVDDQLALARSKLEKHVIAEADMFAPTIYAEQARLSTDRTREDFESAKIALAKLAGAPVLTDDQIPDVIPAVTPASAAVQSQLSAFTSQPELDTFALRNLRRQIEVEKLNYAVTNVRLRPKLSAVVGISQDQQHYSLSDTAPYQVRDTYAGISVYWAIFDGFANSKYKSNTLARQRQLERDYKAQTEDQIAALKAQARQLEFSARNLAIVEKLLDSSSNAVRVRKEDLARGLASDSDVNGAQLAFYDSQLNAFNARYEYLMGVAGLLSSMLEDPALANLPK